MDHGSSTGEASDVSYYHTSLNHSIRHISGIHIRNLTPFPQRDRIISALDGHHSLHGTSGSTNTAADDLELILARKRTRRMSTTSVATFLSRRSEDPHSVSPQADSTIKAAAHAHSSSISSAMTLQLSEQTPMQRRGRSGSTATSLLEANSLSTNPSAVSTSSLSQRRLEQVISSRLFETFITLTESIPPPPPPLPQNGPLRPLMRERTVSSASRLRPLRERSASPAQSPPPNANGNTSRPSSRASNHSTASTSRTTPIRSPPTKPLRAETPSKLRSYTSTDRSPRASTSKSISPVTKKAAPSTPPAKKQLNGMTPSPPTSASVTAPPPSASTPFFISSIHPPSTNPSWSDLKATEDFHNANPRATNVKVTLWARRHSRSNLLDASSKGKGKAVDETPGSSSEEWSSLLLWDVDLNSLEPFAADFRSTAEDLPPNSIVFNLATTGGLYVLPHKNSLDLDSRSRSPSPEHNVSDGEVDVVKARGGDRRRSSVRFHEQAKEAQLRSLRETRMRKGPSMDETARLLKVHFQLDEMEESLQDLVNTIDDLADTNGLVGLQRRHDQLVDSLSKLQEERQETIGNYQTERKALEDRRARLEERRENLRCANYFHDDDLADLDALEEEIESEQSHTKVSKYTRANHRSHLVRDLERIYPIEAISAQDLLFGILSVPLPIPLNPSDPAPPLSHPDWPSVNEDTIATALGYTAQVLLAVSVYLKVAIPYPIVCAGSRSVIKDPISHMHGPRTFPLYSRGVDTYRFEYAVFLLNKDIEMLMTEQGVQTLDMRHTLPNLKNLLLTLTSGLEEDVDTSSSQKTSTHANGDSLRDGSVATTGTQIPGASSPNTSTEADTVLSNGGPTPTNTMRKSFFPPINVSSFWHLRTGSSRALEGASTAPSLSTTPELSASEDTAVSESDVTSPGTPSPSEGQATTDGADEDSLLTPAFDPSSRANDGEPPTPTPANTGTEEETDDTETIKDGTVGRSSQSPPVSATQNSSWITKAFFGQQIDRDREVRERGRDRERDGEKSVGRRRRNPATTTSLSNVTANPSPAETVGAENPGETTPADSSTAPS